MYISNFTTNDVSFSFLFSSSFPVLFSRKQGRAIKTTHSVFLFLFIYLFIYFLFHLGQGPRNQDTTFCFFILFYIFLFFFSPRTRTAQIRHVAPRSDRYTSTCIKKIKKNKNKKQKKTKKRCTTF